MSQQQQYSGLFNGGSLVVKGDEGERAAWHWLKTYYGTEARYEDLRTSPYYQKREIDYRVTPSGARSITFEAKFDRHIGYSSQNVLFELCRIHHTSVTRCAYLGWSVFSEADHVLVWNKPTLILHDFKASVLRRGMQEYVNSTHGKANIGLVPSDDLRTTVNLYVPLSFVPHDMHKWNGATWVQLSTGGAK